LRSQISGTNKNKKHCNLLLPVAVALSVALDVVRDDELPFVGVDGSLGAVEDVTVRPALFMLAAEL
jgi:hypothetical protein